MDVAAKTWLRVVWAAQLLPYWRQCRLWRCRSLSEAVCCTSATLAMHHALCAGVPTPDLIVDIGCHRGEVTGWWCREFPRVEAIGIDAAPTEYPFGRKITAELDSAVTADRVLARWLPTTSRAWVKIDVDDATFDAVCGSTELLRRAAMVHVEVEPWTTDMASTVVARLHAHGFRGRCVWARYQWPDPFRCSEWVFWRL